MSPINEKYIKGPFRRDTHGGYVFGPDDFMFAQVRGWGQLQYGPDPAAVQDANHQFMVDALNEKASGELEWLRWFKSKVGDCLGPASGEIQRDLLKEYLASGKKVPPAVLEELET